MNNNHCLFPILFSWWVKFFLSEEYLLCLNEKFLSYRHKYTGSSKAISKILELSIFCHTYIYLFLFCWNILRKILDLMPFYPHIHWYESLKITFPIYHIQYQYHPNKNSLVSSNAKSIFRFPWLPQKHLLEVLVCLHQDPNKIHMLN